MRNWLQNLEMPTSLLSGPRLAVKETPSQTEHVLILKTPGAAALKMVIDHRMPAVETSDPEFECDSDSVRSVNDELPTKNVAPQFEDEPKIAPSRRRRARKRNLSDYSQEESMSGEKMRKVNRIDSASDDEEDAIVVGDYSSPVK
jgi:hypothetical protein